MYAQNNLFLTKKVDVEKFHILRKGEILRKHSLHVENSSLGFIEAFLQWI